MPSRPSARSSASQANEPRQTTARTVGSTSASSASSQALQVSRSSMVGLLSGGAQRTAATIRVLISRCPSPACVLVGCDGQTDPVQRREQPVAGAVAGEDPAGPVAAVGRRRQPDDEHPRLGAPPAGDRPAPVGLVGERPALLDRDVLAPPHQPRAGSAHRDLGVELGQRSVPRREGDHVGGPCATGVDRVGGIVRPTRPRRHRDSGNRRGAHVDRPGDAVEDVVLRHQQPGDTETAHDLLEHEHPAADHVGTTRMHERQAPGARPSSSTAARPTRPTAPRG